MQVAFDGFVVDTTTFELRREGSPVPMEPQAFDVLAYLIEHRDRVVTKEELLDHIWGDRFVSESALATRIKQVRRALGDDGRRQRWIQTSFGRGYRFIAQCDATDAALAQTVQHNLPADRTPLFGRDRAIEEAAELVGRHRLVSLLGIGGTGKTRLAIAVARSVAGEFPDGVWFVDLVPVSDARGIPTAIAHAAGLAPSVGDAEEQISRILADRATLFVLDNCEHVRDALAIVLDHLLENTSAPSFLVTSRVPLDLPDERRVQVPPLDVDASDAPATALFRSAAERFGMSVVDDNSTVLRICRHLDGLPLAIELAAAQLRLLRPGDIADRLDQRFELLHTRRGPGRERHASLMAVLQDTWTLLESGERELLGRIAAFPGPFSVVDAEQLNADLAGGAVASTLGQLIDCSLVVPTSVHRNRFRLLETVRLFALRQTDAPRHAARHARWCLDQIGDDVRRHQFDFAAAVWCTQHYDDVVAAERQLTAAGRGDDAALLLAGSALAAHVDSGRAADIVVRVEDQLRRWPDPAVAARLHYTAVFAGMASRAPAVIAEHGHAAVDAAQEAGDPALSAIALVFASWSTALSDPSRAMAMVEHAADLATEAGDASTRNLADSYRAFHLARMRRYDEAIGQADEVIARMPSLTDYGYDTFAAIVALTACCAVTEPARVRRWIDHLISRPSPDYPAWGQQVLAAAVYASCGDAAAAATLAEKVRADQARAGLESLPDLLVPAAMLAHEKGEDDRAERWLRAVRDADRPTQSFQVTIVYRRLREALGGPRNAERATQTLEQTGAEALGWMLAVSRGNRGSGEIGDQVRGQLPGVGTDTV